MENQCESITKNVPVPRIEGTEDEQLEFEGDWITENQAGTPYRFVKLCTPEEAVVPDWMNTLELDWIDKYSNSPCFSALTNFDPLRDLDEPLWKRVGSDSWVWQKDGLLRIHYHSHNITWSEERQAYLTPKDKGYAGREYTIMMDPIYPPFNEPGKNKVILRGPWYGGPPPGFTSVNTKPYNRDTCYRFGLEVQNRVIAAAFPKFFPGHKLCLVKRSSNSVFNRLEPVHPSWDSIKAVMLHEEKIKYGYMYANKQPKG